MGGGGVEGFGRKMIVDGFWYYKRVRGVEIFGIVSGIYVCSEYNNYKKDNIDLYIYKYMKKIWIKWVDYNIVDILIIILIKNL